MDAVSSSSSVESSAVSPSIPSAVEAFGGSPGASSPTSPQAESSADRPAICPGDADTAAQSPGFSEESADWCESSGDSPAQPPADDFDFAAELGKSLGEQMKFFNGPGYVPAKRILCKLIATLMTETLIVLDDAMGEAVTLPEYSPSVAAARGEVGGVA